MDIHNFFKPTKTKQVQKSIFNNQRQKKQALKQWLLRRIQLTQFAYNEEKIRYHFSTQSLNNMHLFLSVLTTVK